MTAYYNEFDPFAAQWLRNLIAAGHLPPGDVDSRSILDVQPEDLKGYDQCHFFAGIGIWGYALRRVRWPDDRGIWSGSCPCQPFSAAGKGAGFDDERHLWPAWYHLVTQRRPAIVVGEQVASKDGLEWFDLVSTDLENAGYAVGAADLCAAGFSEQGGRGGGFHLRQRQYFVAFLEGLDDAASARHERAQQDAKANPRDEARLRLPSERGGGSGLADADNAGLVQQFGEPGVPCAPSRAPEGRGDGRGFDACGLADAAYVERDGPGGRGPSGGPEYPNGGGISRVADARGGGREMALLESRGCGTAAAVGQANRAGSGGVPCDDAERQHGVSDNDARRPNANLVYCRDGRWRPIEPGALPLAYAVPRSMGAMRPELRAVCLATGFSERDLAEARKYRAGALKGFGNALDGETVIAFLEAALPLAP